MKKRPKSRAKNVLKKFAHSSKGEAETKKALGVSRPLGQSWDEGLFMTIAKNTAEVLWGACWRGSDGE